MRCCLTSAVARKRHAAHTALRGKTTVAPQCSAWSRFHQLHVPLRLCLEYMMVQETRTSRCQQSQHRRVCSMTEENVLVEDLLQTDSTKALHRALAFAKASCIGQPLPARFAGKTTSNSRACRGAESLAVPCTFFALFFAFSRRTPRCEDDWGSLRINLWRHGALWMPHGSPSNHTAMR